ncbi:DUF167 domain-containing protein [candidate division WOR-3 bacterium]|uniref:UPF0235 protein GF359_09575 n=1 Tax=candidate division WOR-3 bacterium TaxID=2052148 RepID=A0A9D5KAE3_UNCW3|nr:DUF167 domain-containing protein [candidate division WOR-3 bacterium]MBD3365448.1 DUF167 domain-containing protein [candidate division WOR-3 bacterium]
MDEIKVKVVPKSSRARVERLGDDTLKVWVHSAPEKGKANREVRALLARYFSIPRSCIRLIGGERSRTKTFSLDTSRERHNIKDSCKED